MNLRRERRESSDEKKDFSLVNGAEYAVANGMCECGGAVEYRGIVATGGRGFRTRRIQNI